MALSLKRHGLSAHGECATRNEDMKDTPNSRVMKSYVWHGGKCFFVSTMERESSAAILPSPRYNETMVWEYDWDKAERGEIIAQQGAPMGSIGLHIALCVQLHNNGHIPEVPE